MKPGCFVGFDTSNYTTSAAVCTSEGKVVANLKIPLPVKEGECGLRQSDAVFFHVRNLPELCARLREAVAPYTVLAVGCSVAPRQREDSYMPCFLAGKAAAEAFAAAADVPVSGYAHQDGHIVAAAYSSGRMDPLFGGRFAAFHVSGGTTEILLVTPDAGHFSVLEVGGTGDLNAGQAVDRAGVMMGLRFPCGREMEALAGTYRGKIPAFRVSVADRVCHLSGLQNLSEKLWRETGDRAAVSAFVFAFLGKTLAKMTEQLDAAYPGLPVVYAGGVMSNRYLQSVLAKRTDTYFAEAAFSADNAAGIALLTRRDFLAAHRTDGAESL